MHRFPIGTTYKPVGRDYTCTVTDHLTTTNSKGEIVDERYISTHQFLGQSVEDWDVVDATIARGNPNFAGNKLLLDKLTP